MAGRLSGRTAIITGAARGIGAATATRFAEEGADVVLVDRDADPLSAVAETIRSRSGRCATTVGDCADPAVADAAISAALEGFGGLDVLVNNAGSACESAFHTIDDADWRRVQRDNVETTIAMTRAFVAAVRPLVIAELTRDGRWARQRKITNTSAASTISGSPGSTALASAGGAVLGLTRTLARELGSFGVNVNAVAPGFIETRLTRVETADDPSGIPEPVRQMTRAMTALGRWGTPADIARVHVFLASDDADFVSGVTIPVTGGLLGTTT